MRSSARMRERAINRARRSAWRSLDQNGDGAAKHFPVCRGAGAASGKHPFWPSAVKSGMAPPAGAQGRGETKVLSRLLRGYFWFQTANLKGLKKRESDR